MPIYSSDSSEDERMASGKFFGRQKPIYEILGGGKVAEVLLWEDKRLSSTILIGISAIWFLFEVIEYNFLTLLCHIVMTTMLVIFIWCMASDIFKWPPPRIPEIILHESTFREVAGKTHKKLNRIVSKFFDVAAGHNFRHFISAIGILWIISSIGNYISTLNLLFLGCLCLETLPYMYYKNEEQVDHLVWQVGRQMRKSYRKFEREVIGKIPRGPVKPKKHS